MGQQRAASAIWRDQNKPISRASDELWDSRCNKTCYAAQRQRHELTSGIHKISIYSPGLTNPCNSMGQLQDLPVMGWLCTLIEYGRRQRRSADQKSISHGG